MIETTNPDLHKERWSTGEAISKQAVEKPEANQMEYTSLKSATKHLAENLQIHVFPVAEVIVRENNLKVLQTSCSLSWLFTSTTLLQREENEDREMEILYSGDEAFFQPVFLLSQIGTASFLANISCPDAGLPFSKHVERESGVNMGLLSLITQKVWEIQIFFYFELFKETLLRYN